MIFNLGSINADVFYQLPHLPVPGETLSAEGFRRGLGGKGANQSVAVARAGGEVKHLGAIGADGQWMLERMKAAGVECRDVRVSRETSGHAVIYVDAGGENTIVIHPGANRAVPEDVLDAALEEAGPEDMLILQNETNLQVEAARMAAEQGLYVVYSAAPFDAQAVQAVLPHVSLLICNEVEAAQLSSALGVGLADLPVPAVVVTRGGAGAEWHDLVAGEVIAVPTHPVEVVDTTGAGDTFAGYLVAGLAEGLAPGEAMRLATGAAALKVTRAGTADAIPTREEVDAFLAAQG